MVRNADSSYDRAVAYVLAQKRRFGISACAKKSSTCQTNISRLDMMIITYKNSFITESVKHTVVVGWDALKLKTAHLKIENLLAITHYFQWLNVRLPG